MTDIWQVILIKINSFSPENISVT